MKRIVIGTAGHIDHGKTTLVKALTGIETDRLKEEQQRGISIELGFAPFVLPSGQNSAIVDMPGHEKFIKHMLAGAFGIDLVILTIAADEGIMPQTREHIDIIELLGIDNGVIVITKKDLVDEEWLMLMEEEIKEYMAKTILKDAPVISVSAVKKQNIDELINLIEELTLDIPEKPAFGHARMPIDRKFTVAGFGTVVTGTLWSGQFSVGDILQLMPAEKEVKIRTLQVHNDKVSTAHAGRRVAVNLQGIELSEINRGDWLATPGFLHATYRVDAKFRLINSTSRVISNWNRIRFHLGTDEALGRIILLDRDELVAGDEAYVQIVLEKPIVCYKGDPFVVRYYSPVTTIGGGTIIDSNAPKQKRFRDEVLEQLAMKEEGSLAEVLTHEMESNPYQVFHMEELTKRTGNTTELVKDELENLRKTEKVVEITKEEFISTFGLDLINDTIIQTLKSYHDKYPLRTGYPKEDMRSRFFATINRKSFNYILKHFENNATIVSRNNLLSLAEHKPIPSEPQRKVIKTIVNQLGATPFTPPALTEIKEKLVVSDDDFSEIISHLISEDIIVKLSQDIFFTKSAIEEGKNVLIEYFSKERELTLATTRDMFKTTRKYALPLLEYYDQIRFTKRIGDIRVKM
ncbi:MAG TPA: selenocysteine-specific translation elongation factor [Syntrophomonadaceae bacterium]|nr:selenocysteine-specific translation elongation factor [Syntrophomonadaceae bacterium]